MKCFVTGASGFVGANLVHELNARGHDVTCLLRPGADRRGLAGADFQVVEGDLSNPRDYSRSLAGCDWLFHVAASYHLWMRDYKPMYAANVEGTRNILRAAIDAGVSRIVYTSTVGCVGLPQEGPDGQPPTPSDESCVAGLEDMKNDYKRSKWLAEEIVHKIAHECAPVVIVNPSAPIGPRDAKPTPTGRVIVDFLNRKMPAYLDTGLNWVHVRDVAIGHILAAERGVPGQRYILGNADGNWTMRQTFEALAEITGLPAPRFQIPYPVAYAAALVDESISAITGRHPKAPIAGVRMARHKMWFNPAKAIRELGLPQTAPRQALADAVEWFRQNGFVNP